MVSHLPLFLLAGAPFLLEPISTATYPAAPYFGFTIRWRRPKALYRNPKYGAAVNAQAYKSDIASRKNASPASANSSSL